VVIEMAAEGGVVGALRACRAVEDASGAMLVARASIREEGEKLGFSVAMVEGVLLDPRRWWRRGHLRRIWWRTLGLAWRWWIAVARHRSPGGGGGRATHVRSRGDAQVRIGHSRGRWRR
jgi:hypothetical protein